MSTLRTTEILQQFAKWKDRSVRNIDLDISDITPLLQEYLTEAGLDQLNEDENQFPNFPEVAVILEHSGFIYSRKVDNLFKIVQEAVLSIDTPSTRDGANEDRVIKRIRKPAELLDFKHIELEEANNIDIKENHEPKPITMLPKAFIQFEPRIISENDIKLKDYNGETIGLMSDFRVNWNTDENFMLCDDMDFCTANNSSDMSKNVEVPISMVSPSDSGHTSDCYVDFNVDPSDQTVVPDTPTSTIAMSAVSPETPMVDDSIDATLNMTIVNTPSTIATVIDKQVVSKVKKRRLPFTTPVAKKIARKFTMTSQLTGTAKDLQLTPFEFTLPFLNKIMEQRIHEKKNLKRFIDDVHSSNDMDAKFLMNNISPIFKKQPPMTWSRREIYKKLKISRLKFDELDIDNGFYDDDNDGEELTKRLNALEKICERLEALPIEEDELDKFSECSNTNCAEDDDIPDNCIENQNNVFEPGIEKRLAELNSEPKSFLFVEQSDISKRVEAWHMSIYEKLKLTENRKNFDIEDYSKNVINTFKSEESGVISFSDIMKEQPPGETARYFLTTLMLANKSQVIIKQPEPLSCGDFQISLGKVDSKKKLNNLFF